MSNTDNAVTTDSVVTVWLEEEYGYRYWRWDTGMTLEKLIAWWTALPSVIPFFFDPKQLPGRLAQLDFEEWTDAVTVRTKGYKGRPTTLFITCADEHRDDIVRAHLHQDDDSCLVVPDLGLIRHAGYQAEPI